MTGFDFSSGQTPATRVESQLAEEIGTHFGAPDDTDVLAIARNAVNDAIRMLNTRNWRWGLAFVEIATVAGQSEYDLSTDWRAPRSLELLDGSGNVNGRIAWQDPKSFSDLTGDGTTGDPCLYTVFNADDGVLTLDAAPSAVFVSQHPTLRVRY